jgi:hypothetical protein
MPMHFLLEPLYLLFGLPQMRGECLGELGMVGRLRHLRQRFHQHFLGAPEVLELIDVEIPQRLHFHKSVLRLPKGVALPVRFDYTSGNFEAARSIDAGLVTRRN